ncbi:hypothetical protein JW835_06680 [bacterium]|nr:hypothetical protein [bacterium]
MNIKKYMKEHESSLREQLLLKGSRQTLDILKTKHQRMIQYMQQERLIHLIVTLAFGVFLLTALAIVLIKPNLQSVILIGLFLILLVPYISHYFYLENTVQVWYKLMDDIESRARS